MGNELYAPVRATLPDVLPPLTAVEAERAVRRLYRHFAKPMAGRQLRVPKVRRCWVTRQPTTGHFRGWGRLVHDVSHLLFRATYPAKRPHDPLHARYELEVAAYVAGTDWLAGGLRPKVKAPPSPDEVAARELARLEARLKAWRTKAKRAATAIRNLEKQIKRAKAREVRT